MKAPARPDKVALWLRSDDAEVLLAYCETILDQAVGPYRWVWWRIRQACVAAINAAGDSHVVDQHVH